MQKYLIPGVIIGLIVIVILFKSYVTIKSGDVGVIYRTFGGGVDTEVILGEGFHLIAPWNDVFVYGVRQQEVFETMSVLSANGLDIELEATIWFQPVYSDVAKLHKYKGEDYIDRIIKPAVRSAARSVIGRYTPEEIYSTKRELIQQEIFVETEKVFDPQYIQLNEVLVRDVNLPPTIKDAIERKLSQEQESLEYEFRLQKAKKEAERQRIDAEGKAAANKILSASLTDKILKEKAIEATVRLSSSPNAKVVVIGAGEDGMPMILGNQ